jgi:trigger factor
MKKIKLIIAWMLIAAMLTFAGCSSGNNDTTGDDANTDTTADTDTETDTDSSADETSFSYSDGIDENGFWTGITASDYVTLCNYKGIEIPEETHAISDDSVQSQIDSILDDYSESVNVTDRAVEDGDTVNIDYVGSIGGVEFDGGSTGGAGTDVTIGVTQYIDDFLEQLIGHTPGEEFDVNVTFPEDYGNEELNGKDAVFDVTINYIVETNEPELTDDFVAENLNSTYGWSTVDEMKEGIRQNLQNTAIESYVQEYIHDNSEVSEIPESILNYIESSMVAYYESYASQYGMDIDSFLSSYVGVESEEALLEQYKNSNVATAEYYLVIQAIAEKENISAEESDIAAYFENTLGVTDYSQYESNFGHPYLVQVALFENVLDYLSENAVLK